MKKQILLITAVLVALFAYNANAQLRLSVNIGVQPVWGPVGYDHVDYYYIPDVDAYYDVPHQQYTYYEGNQWVTRPSLPPRYSGFDLYSAHKVVMNEQSPWRHYDRDRTQYAQYRGRHDQHPIRDSHEERYRENPNHPEHGQWHGNNGHDNGNHGNNEHGGRGHEEHEGHGHEEHGH